MRKAVFIMQLCENGGNYYSALNGRQMSWNTSMSIKSGFRFEFPTREDYKLLEKVLRSSKEIRTLELSAEQVADLRKHYFIASRNGHEVICDVRSRKPLLTEELALDILNEEFQVNGRKGLLDFVEDLKSYYHSVPNAFVHDFFADKVQTSDSSDTSSTELWQEDVVHEQRFKGGLYSPVLLVDFKKQLPIAIAFPCADADTNNSSDTIQVKDQESLFVVAEVLDKRSCISVLHKDGFLVWKTSECIDGCWETVEDIKKSLMYVKQYLQDYHYYTL
uniref:Uncharacterized protein n=1 Tax=Trichuris muris TaxID=70415 RepID=A0A5S6QGA1_TRIMR